MPGLALALLIAANIGYFHYGASIETVAILLGNALVIMVGSISFEAFMCKEDKDG